MGTIEWPRALLVWFDLHRRSLPWREAEPRNPYHVWIAEIMLQQTRAEAVRPYFAAWMARFPTIGDVAAAEEAEVLRAWQGLGYYSRARNIHRAARVMEASWNGAMPRALADIRALPGIGDYTAGAIASIAYGERVPAVDGNVLRVYARLYAVTEDVLKRAGRKQIEKLAQETIPADRPGAFNEALMDLGSEVCIPKRPRCADCPLRRWCRAVAAGMEAELPLRTKKKPQTEWCAACAVVERDGRFLMHRRPATGMLASMWEFPMALARTEEESRQALEARLGGRTGALLWSHTHVFTHRIWHMRAYEVKEARAPTGGDWRWFDRKDWDDIPLAGPHARLAAFL